MEKATCVNLLFHRSRQRIRALGEVFTPESYVDEMLAMLAKSTPGAWSDTGISFFEPTCGHGNIVVAILRKRLDSIFKKSLTGSAKEAAFYAVANALNTLWAIDIDPKNVTQCRARVFSVIVEFLKEKSGSGDLTTLVKRNQDFIAHILCAVKWHITENEALSALSGTATKAAVSASQTRYGEKWFKSKGHSPLVFEKTWASSFEESANRGAISAEFARATRFIKQIVDGTGRASTDFNFANILISPEITPRSSRVSSGEAVGA